MCGCCGCRGCLLTRGAVPGDLGSRGHHYSNARTACGVYSNFRPFFRRPLEANCCALLLQPSFFFFFFCPPPEVFMIGVHGGGEKRRFPAQRHKRGGQLCGCAFYFLYSTRVCTCQLHTYPRGMLPRVKLRLHSRLFISYIVHECVGSVRFSSSRLHFPTLFTFQFLSIHLSLRRFVPLEFVSFLFLKASLYIYNTYSLHTLTLTLTHSHLLLSLLLEPSSSPVNHLLLPVQEHKGPDSRLGKTRRSNNTTPNTERDHAKR